MKYQANFIFAGPIILKKKGFGFKQAKAPCHSSIGERHRRKNRMCSGEHVWYGKKYKAKEKK